MYISILLVSLAFLADEGLPSVDMEGVFGDDDAEVGAMFGQEPWRDSLPSVTERAYRYRDDNRLNLRAAMGEAVADFLLGEKFEPWVRDPRLLSWIGTILGTWPSRGFEGRIARHFRGVGFRRPEYAGHLAQLTETLLTRRTAPLQSRMDLLRLLPWVDDDGHRAVGWIVEAIEENGAPYSPQIATSLTRLLERTLPSSLKNYEFGTVFRALDLLLDQGRNHGLLPGDADIVNVLTVLLE